MPSDLRVLTLPSTHLAAASPDVRPVTPADAIDLATIPVLVGQYTKAQ